MANPKMPVESSGGGLLDGLRSKKSDKPNGGYGFIMTESQDRVARSGGTPSGFVRDKEGRLRPLVQGGD